MLARGRWWMGVAAGVAAGLAGIAAVEAATGDAAAQRSEVRLTKEQLVINQRISQAAVRRSNEALRRIEAAGTPVAGLWAVSSGVAGTSNLLRGRGATASQRVGRGDQRVTFAADISGCSWTGTPTGDGPLPPAAFVRIALDTTDPGRTRLIVRTLRANNERVDSGFSVLVAC